MSNDKHDVTFDGEPVMRRVSRADIRAYMNPKGFRLGNRSDNGEIWTLAPVGEFDLTTPAVCLLKINEENPAETRTNVAQVARCLDREPRDVLREIAGEAVTLEDAWNALVSAVPKGAKSSVDVPYFGAASSEALLLATEWRGIALAQQRAPHMSVKALAEWLRVALAAEDLATIALADLRRARKATQ